jgi:hypothetical protein
MRALVLIIAELYALVEGRPVTGATTGSFGLASALDR